MNKLNIFDVLVVYTESIATSALNATNKYNKPFSKGKRNESYNTVYAYFLETCAKYNLKAALTTSADIIGAGCCDSFWTYEEGRWKKNNSACFSNLIFDKFSPTRRRILGSRKTLFSSDDVKPFNDPVLFDLFFDKQRTFDTLSEYSIPTVSLNDRSEIGVYDACGVLKDMMENHPVSDDFCEEIVLKDRFGAGGRHVYKFNINQIGEIVKILRKTPSISYIVQPFVDFERGFCYKNHATSTDVRLIYLNGKIVQSYIRIAKTGDFRCNEHQGGSLIYLSPDEIPQKLVKKSNLVAEKLDNNSLFALDFIVSNKGNVFLLEGNTGPGLDWNMSLRRNEMEAKKLIELIVEELAYRATPHIDFSESLLVPDFVSGAPLLTYVV